MRSSTSAASRVAVLKDILNLLRDASLFALVVMLLAFPDTFNQILTKAGFVKGSLLGFEWQTQLHNSNTDLQRANDLIGTLKFTAANQKVSEQAENVQNSLAQTLQNNATLLQPQSVPTWVVVVANEANREDADNFIRSASKQIAEGFPGKNYKLCMAPTSTGSLG